MRDLLFIRPGGDIDSPQYTWLRVSADGACGIAITTDDPDTLRTEAAGQRVIVLIGAADVRLAEITVPTRQATKVLQAAPYLLEEQIADDLDTLHFALGSRDAVAGTFPVAIVRRARLDAALAPLQSAGIDIEAVVPEHLCLPPPGDSGAWHVLAEPDLYTVRTSRDDGFSCSPDDFTTFATAALGDAVPPSLRVLLGNDSVDTSALGARIELLPGYRSPLEVLARSYKPENALNLLQGAYSRRENLARLWRPWRLAAALAALTFIAAVGGNAAWAWRLNHEADQLQSANAERFHQLFPDEPTSLELSLALQQEEHQLRGSGADTGLLSLLAPLAQGLKTSGGLDVAGLQYREHVLYADLTGQDLQALEKLRDWFRNHPDVKLEVQSANADGGNVQIRIKLSNA